MGTYTVYRLTFKTQLHLGRSTGAAQTGNLGLETTETYISADTLFSAFCQMWSTFYGTNSLTKFLERYGENSETLPFMLTSAFPFTNDVYLFPKPLTWEYPSKESKRIQFVSKYIFQQLVAGNPPTYDKDQLITGQKVWISNTEREQLKIPNDEDFNVWTTSTRPRVTIGAQNAGSEIWHIQTVQFNKKCGLWFAADFNGDDEMKQKFETLLRVLGDCGIGGERNSGYGQFKFTPTELDIPNAEDSNQFVTLSPVSPKSMEQLAEIRKGDVAYILNQCTGRISAFGSGAQRKQVNMFSEGSVLNAPNERVGRLVDLTPEDYNTHSVLRYGFAWQVGIKGTENEKEIQT